MIILPAGRPRLTAFPVLQDSAPIFLLHHVITPAAAERLGWFLKPALMSADPEIYLLTDRRQWETNEKMSMIIRNLMQSRG